MIYSVWYNIVPKPPLMSLVYTYKSSGVLLNYPKSGAQGDRIIGLLLKPAPSDTLNIYIKKEERN